MAADIFVMSFLYEGLSIAATEAATMRLPAAFTHLLGLRDLKQDYDGTFYAQPNINSLLNGIVTLLAESDEKRRLRSKNYPTISRCLNGIFNGLKAVLIYSGY